MRNLVLAVGLTAACSGTDRPGSSPEPVVSSERSADAAAVTPDASPSTESSAPVPGMLLGHVPTTSSYRVIACALGPERRRSCEGLLERLVGAEVRAPNVDGVGTPLPVTASKITRTGLVQTTNGDTVAVELDKPSGPVVTSSATLRRKAATLTEAEASALRKQVRAISPRARWATGERFELVALEADLDGDHEPDRIALGTLVDFKRKEQRFIAAIAVGVAGKPLEIVDWDADASAILGTVDLNGDGRHEVLIDRRAGAGDSTNYRYTLMHVLPDKPLAMDLKKPAPSEGWQPYDLLEDQPRDELVR